MTVCERVWGPIQSRPGLHAGRKLDKLDLQEGEEHAQEMVAELTSWGHCEKETG